jgi:hypothetical protein
MTPNAHEHPYTPVDNVDVNPFLVFVVVLVLPYLLFYILLMLVTGEINIVLLYESVMSNSHTALIKTWVIGTFVLAVASSLFTALYRTGSHLGHRQPPRSQFHQKVNFVIESAEHVEEAEATKTRHAALQNVVGTREQ